jgi:polysaccharide pyruvyl transferase WcaK-like protein
MKILFAGSSGYGNMGDDAYKELFSEYLPKHELMFDSPYPDLRTVDWCDALVIGGGGLIYSNGTAHEEYMFSYLDKAIQQNKPIFFISVGVQFYPQHEKKLTEVLHNWKKYLDIAKVITVRSPRDKEMIEAITDNKNIFYYPDFCYLIKPVNYHLTLPNAVIFTITGLALKNGSILQEYEKNKDKLIYTVAMSRDDIVNTKIFLDKFGLPENHLINRDNLSPRECARIFADADKVISSRYHSIVFSRAVGCKEIINYDLRHKSQVEPSFDSFKKEDAINHVKELEKWLNAVQ